MQCIHVYVVLFKIKTQDIVEFVKELFLLSGIGTFESSSIRDAWLTMYFNCSMYVWM